MKTFFLAAAALLLAALPVWAQTRTPLTLSGFNQDVIANGTYLTAATVALSTSAQLDTSGNVYYQKGFNPNNTALGLTTGTSFTSASNASTSFQIASATANNVLLLGSNTTGALTLASYNSFSSLAFLVTGLNGSLASTYTLNFSDGTTSAGTFTALDNYDNTPYALAGFGRVSRSTGAFSGDTTNDPRLYEIDVTLSAANSTRTLQSITFGNTASSGNLAVFDVSGSVVPEPATWLAGILLCAGALFTLTRRRQAIPR